MIWVPGSLPQYLIRLSAQKPCVDCICNRFIDDSFVISPYRSSVKIISRRSKERYIAGVSKVIQTFILPRRTKISISNLIITSCRRWRKCGSLMKHAARLGGECDLHIYVCIYIEREICKFTFIFIYIYVRSQIHVHVHIYIYIYIHIYLYKCELTYLSLYIYMWTYISLSIYIYKCELTYLSLYIYTYIYIYI